MTPSFHAIFLMLVVASANLSAIEMSEPEVAVEVAKSSLSSRWDYNWYDGSTDELARFDVAPPANMDWFEAWFKGWGEFWDVWNIADLFATFGWVCIAVILAVIAYLLIRAYLESEQGTALSSVSSHAESAAETLARIESLPIDVRDPHADLLAEARRHYRDNNLPEAIIYLFGYQLVELDKLHCLRITKGKTNRQYVREVIQHTQRGPTPALAGHLQQTMRLFEDSFFGGHAPGKAAFEACWNRLEQFQTLLTQHAGANA